MRRAFTLVELLLVISLFVLLLAISVPAFSSMLYSSDQSLADNSLRVGLGAARDAAVRSAQGQDAVAAFLYDPVTGRTMIVPCLKAGEVMDADTESARGRLVAREVFVPVPGFEPVQFPRGWMVRGYTMPQTIDGEWYGGNYGGMSDVFRAPNVRRRGNWVFPETGFYDETRGDEGTKRQTFVVRFEGGTGVLKAHDLSKILVVAPSPSVSFRNSAPWNKPGMRVDQEEDLSRFVRRVSSSPVSGGTGLTIIERQRLLGDVASDTVLAKPVGQLAVYNERRLAGAIGARIDSATGSLYQNPGTMNPAFPAMVAVRGAAFSEQHLDQVNQWIEGRLSLSGEPVDSDCRIYTIQRYLGTLQEMTGSRMGQGVGG